jgi:mRNA-degrading endonuclease toxin of MazEF toxin-antitoxin module
MKINQRDIVEVQFQLPNGSIKNHPALVISNNAVLETEDIFYAVMISTKDYNDEFTFTLNSSMCTKPLSKISFIKCQLIQSYSETEVISKISSLKSLYFEEVKKMIMDTVF